MHPIHFFSHVQHDAIVEAIRRVEGATTGKIRIFVSRRKIADPLRVAQRRFAHLDMHQSPHRNAILIFVAPRSQKFAVVGDQAVHARVGDAAWQALVAQMAEHFKHEQIMPALLSGIDGAGKLLAEHFPNA